jgi:hypothetical protein
MALRAFLCLLLLAGASARAAPPRIEITAPPELAADARLVAEIDPASFLEAQEMTGLLSSGAPIRVALEPESSQIARETPRFITGFARGEEVVVFPRRGPRYPSGELADVVRHEVAHVLLFRAAGGRELPRWFHEGVAMAASRPRNLEDRARLLVELFKPAVPLRDLETLFSGGEASVDRAYTLAGSLVEDLLETYGRGLPGAVASRVAKGSSFEDAFTDVTGVPLAVEDWRFVRRQRSKERWLLVLTSSATVWTAVTVLGIAAMLKRRKRDAARRRQWESEEAGTSLALFVPEADHMTTRREREPRNLNDPDHGLKTRHSDRPEFDDSDKEAEEGWAGAAVAVDEAETMASTGDAANSFVEIASGTATGMGIDRGITTGTGGLAAGEDLDPVAEGDYWRENFVTRPYYQAGMPYEWYEPGYRLGWEAATDLQFAGREFEEIKTELEKQWFEGMGEDAASWEEIQPAAQDAWERIKKGVPVPRKVDRKEPGETTKRRD